MASRAPGVRLALCSEQGAHARERTPRAASLFARSRTSDDAAQTVRAVAVPLFHRVAAGPVVAELKQPVLGLIGRTCALAPDDAVVLLQLAKPVKDARTE